MVGSAHTLPTATRGVVFGDEKTRVPDESQETSRAGHPGRDSPGGGRSRRCSGRTGVPPRAARHEAGPYRRWGPGRRASVPHAVGGDPLEPQVAHADALPDAAEKGELPEVGAGGPGAGPPDPGA